MKLKNCLLPVALMLGLLNSAHASEYLVTIKDAQAAKWNGTGQYAAMALTARFERLTVREVEANGKKVLLITVTHVMPAHPLANRVHMTGREIKKTCELTAGETCEVADEEGVELARIKQVL